MSPTLRLLRWLDRWILGLFFRRFEVDGAERVPTDRPQVLVANHFSALVDAMLLFAAFPAIPRFLAKNTLWKNPLLRPLLEGARVIPVYRRQDKGVDTSKNAETFSRCHEVLRDGGTIGLFPEGTSHSEPALLPLKTGAARIVLEAEERFGPLGLQVVPVGLIFDDKGKFRSRVLVRVGEAIDPMEVVRGHDDPKDAVRALTDEIRARLEEVTPNFESWDQAQRIARAVEIFRRNDPDLPDRPELRSTFDAHRAFLAGYRRMVERYPERVAAVEQAVVGYQDLLDAAGVRDRQVAARYALPSVTRHLAGRLARMAIRLPIALVGTVLNILPYFAVSLLALGFQKPDQQATYKIFPAMLIYPFFWLAQGFGLGHLLGFWPGLAALLLAPLTGPMALRFHDDRRQLLSEAVAFVKLGTRRELAGELRKRRAQVRQQVAEAVELYRAFAEIEPTPNESAQGASAHG